LLVVLKQREAFLLNVVVLVVVGSSDISFLTMMRVFVICGKKTTFKP